jgi:2-methylisocitrate lyase-like PEP mutase family enzyme
MMLAHIREIVEATDLPVNADFADGFGRDPAGVAESVRLCAETGVAGLSVEDSTGDAAQPLYDLDTAIARMRAARTAIDKAASDVLLVGRCECFLVGRPDIAETVTRLKAYSAAGADCLYAPGIRTREEIAAVSRSGRAQAGQRDPLDRGRAHRGRARCARRAPHQRRQRICARGLGCVDQGGAGHLGRWSL